MNIWSKSFILMALIAGITIQGAELKENVAQLAINDELLNAVQAGPTDRVRTLLLEKANPNYQKENTTPLLTAIGLHHADVVELLLCQGADANQGSYDNPLMTAIKCMDHYILKGDTIAELYVYIIKLLLDHGADPNNRNPVVLYSPFCKCLGNYRSHNGSTPYLKTLELLLEYGADDTTSYNGKTIHDDAETNPELQRILKDHAIRAKKEIATTWSGLPMAVVQLCADKLYVTDDDRVLCGAVLNGKVRETEVLLKKNAHPRMVLCRRAVLEIAADHYNIPIIKLLLQHKADPNVNNPLHEGEKCVKPLERICMNIDKFSIINSKFLGCVELLLKHGSDVNACTMTGDPYIINAAKINSPELVTLYLKYGADAEQPDKDGKALRDYASAEVLQACDKHSQRCKKHLAQAAPQLTHAQDFRDQKTDLTARIAEYI